MIKHLAAVSVAVSLLVTFIGSATVSAASPNISRSYEASNAIPTGSLVSLVSSNSNYVQEANTSNAQRLIGVVVNTNQSLLAVNPSNSTVQVATDGIVDTLVSTANGNITIGQQIAVSPFNGVGMKSSNDDRIIGTADTVFNNSTPGAINETVIEGTGKERQLTVGYVKLSIAVGSINNSNFSTQSLQQFVKSLTGHPISLLRVVISIVVSFVAILTIAILIYSSIYGSIISIGRNPLAKLTVYRTLTAVIGMVVIIAVVATFCIYLLVY